MDKLIRFINEYGHTSSCWPFETYRIEPATEWNSSYLVLSRDDNWEWDWKSWYLEVPRLISKEYWFIKWLVENDKIDLSKLYHDMRLEFGDYYWLLMQLSISDTPIEDLLLYLK